MYRCIGIILSLFFPILALANINIISNYPLPKNNLESVLNTQNYLHVVEMLKSLDIVREIYLIEAEEGITIYIERYPIVRSITIRGNRSIEDADLKIKSGIYEGIPWKDLSYDTVSLRLEELYKEEGFLDAKIKVSGELSEDGYIDLSIDVDEGNVYFYKGSQFENTSLNVEELEKATKLTKGSIAKEEDFITATYNIQDYYVNLGFFDAVVFLKDIQRKVYNKPYFRVLLPQLEKIQKKPFSVVGSFIEGLSNFLRHPLSTIKALAGKGNFAVPIYTVREGIFYKVNFEGNTFFSKEDLLQATGFKDKGVDLFTLESAKINIAKLYRSKGFFDVEVSYVWEEDNINFNIKEGQRYTHKGEFFDEETVKKEIQEKLTKLKEQGYTLATAKYEVIPNKEEKVVNVTINIDKGKKQVLRELIYSGDDKEIKNIFMKFNDKLPAIYDTNIIERLNVSLDEFFLRKGYLDGDFKIDVELIEDDDHIFYTYVYQIQKGERYELADDLFFGAKHTILREISYMTVRSKYYSKDLDNETLSNMLSTGIFSSVKIDTFLDKENKKLYRLIQVTEDKRGFLDLSLGYNTQENLTFDITLGWNNLFGVGMNTSLNYKKSQKKELYSVNILDNFLFTRKLWFKSSLFKNFEDHKSYDLDTKGIATTLGYRIGRYTSVGPSFYLLENKVFGKDYNIRKLGIFLLRDYKDDIFLPTRGHYNSIQLTYATGSANYAKLEVQSYYFLPLRRDFGLSFKLSGGYVSKKAPIFEKFFLGGFRDLRGYSYEEIGQPGGGNYYGFGRLELEIPIKLPAIGVLFVDVGNVSNRFKGLSSKVKWSYGVGAGVRTPIGPVKLEVAFPSEEKFYKKFKLYFSVGYFY